MKSWLIFVIPLLVIILVSVLFQLQKTRNAMVEFAKRHGMKYQKHGKNPFAIGEIKGRIGRNPFFLGYLSENFGFGPGAEKDYQDEKYFYMYIGVEKMPEKLIVREREPGMVGNIIMILQALSKSVYCRDPWKQVVDFLDWWYKHAT